MVRQPRLVVAAWPSSPPSRNPTSEVAALRQRFPLLPDSPAVFDEWLALVEKLPISGKRVHDARWVAVLKACHLDHLLTFNTADFNAFTGVSVVDPSALVA